MEPTKGFEGKSLTVLSREQDDVWVVSINGQSHRMLIYALRDDQTVSKSATPNDSFVSFSVVKSSTKKDEVHKHDSSDHKSRSHPALSPRGAPNFRHTQSKGSSSYHHHHASAAPPPLPATPCRRIPVEIKEKDALLTEIKDLYAELESLKDNLYFVKKGWSCHFASPPNHPNLKVDETPDSQMFEKMLDTPYKRVGLEDVSEMALASARPMCLKLLIYPAFNLNALAAEDVQKLGSLDFNVLGFYQRIPTEYEREHYLWMLLMTMFHKLDLVREFQISELNLYRFIGTVCRRYRDVPFHNWYHGFNVTQTMYYLLVTCECQKLFTKLELFSMLISAICHDADHPGLNNIFHAKAGSKIANLHKKSTLENHHFLQAMSVLSLPECNILENLNKSQMVELQLNIRDMILATDLSLHKLILSSMETHRKTLAKAFKAGKPNQLPREKKVPAMCCIMKCSDLSNEIRPKDIALLWATRVNREFFAQSAKEKEMNLPLTPWIDPEKIVIEKEQINFITGLCTPLYKTLQGVFPTVSPCLDQLKKNLTDWEWRLQEMTTREEAAKLSARSVWEDDQEAGKGGKDLSANLGNRTNASVNLGKK